MIYAVIFGIVAVIIVLSIFITVNHNKFQYIVIKLDEAENNIDVLLDKKKELLDRTRPIIKKELKIDAFLEELETLNDENINHFEKNNLLKDLYYDLFKVLDENEKLYKSESLNSIIEELNDNEDNIVGTIKYYNDNVVIFNKLVMSFPSKIYAFLFHYKKKDFYNNERREINEIMRDK